MQFPSDGELISPSRLADLLAFAHDFFNTMSQHVSVMPSKFTSNFPLYWKHLFIQTMEDGFDEVRHCKGYWKGLKVGSVQLSSFKKTRKALFIELDSDGEELPKEVDRKPTTLGKRRMANPPEKRYRKVVVIDDSDDDDVPQGPASSKCRALQDSEEEDLVPRAPRPKPKPRMPDPL